MRSLRTCHMSLGSLTVGMREAKDFVGSLVPYNFLMIRVFCNAVCFWVNSCQRVERCLFNVQSSSSRRVVMREIGIECVGMWMGQRWL